MTVVPTSHMSHNFGLILTSKVLLYTCQIVNLHGKGMDHENFILMVIIGFKIGFAPQHSYGSQKWKSNFKTFYFPTHTLRSAEDSPSSPFIFLMHFGDAPSSMSVYILINAKPNENRTSYAQ